MAFANKKGLAIIARPFFAVCIVYRFRVSITVLIPGMSAMDLP